MFFRFIILTAVLMTAVGCSEFFDGKKQAAEVIELSNDRFSCLENLPETLKSFSVGEASEEKIESSVTCLQGALTDFQKKTRGSLADAYTIEDMRKFFGKYFLKKNNVTPELAFELVKIKKALLGGSDKHITKAEILKLVELFDIVKEEAVTITPHIKVLLNQSTDKKITYDRVSKAIESLRSTLQRILRSTQISKSEYSFEDLKKALTGLASFIQGQEDFAPYQRYSDWMPLIDSVKRVLMGEQAQFTSQKAWSYALDNIIDLYELALKYHYVIQDFKVGNKAELRQMADFLGQALSLIESSHQMRTSERILFSDIDLLLEQVFMRMNISLRMGSVRELYQTVILKMLEPNRQGDSRGLQALKIDHIKALRREFNIWRLGQAFVDHLPFGEKQMAFSQDTLKTYSQKFRSPEIIATVFPGSSLEQTALNVAWRDFDYFIQSPRLMNFTNEGRLWGVYNPNLYGYTWSSLTKFNLMKTLGRLLMLGYGQNIAGSLTSATMTEQGLITWYSDFKNIGIDLKAFDPRKANSGSRSFLEANFFTVAGNGDDLMGIAETTEFVGLLMSAGLGTANSIQKSMIAQKCETADVDVFKFQMLDAQCFKDALRRNFGVYFNNLPWMTEEVRKFTPTQWDEFYQALWVSSQVDQPTPHRVEMAEVRAMVTVLHYIENIMTIYDNDQSGGLSLTEVYSAAPRFMCFFKSVSPVKNETIIREGFAHLVFYGEMPDLLGLIGFQWGKSIGIDDARRTHLLKILQTLKDQMGQAQASTQGQENGAFHCPKN